MRKISLPVPASVGPPLTGASRHSTPFALAALATSRQLSGSGGSPWLKARPAPRPPEGAPRPFVRAAPGAHVGRARQHLVGGLGAPRRRRRQRDAVGLRLARARLIGLVARHGEAGLHQPS